MCSLCFVSLHLFSVYLSIFKFELLVFIELYLFGGGGGGIVSVMVILVSIFGLISSLFWRLLCFLVFTDDRRTSFFLSGIKVSLILILEGFGFYISSGSSSKTWSCGSLQPDVEV